MACDSVLAAFRRASGRIHSDNISAGLPSQRQFLETNIRRAQGLPNHLRLKVLTVLESLPEGERLCHGDLCAGNILMAAQGEAIINWYRAARGNPLDVLARSTNAAQGYLQTDTIRRAFLSFDRSMYSRVKNSLFRTVGRITCSVYLRRWLPVSGL